MPLLDKRRRAGCGLIAAIMLATASVSAQAAPRRVALLVGVGQFAQAQIPALEGPANDVRALKDILVRRWQFDAKDIVTLIDQEATREAILKELQALQRRTSSGDEVLIYLSGHGTSALDESLRLPLPHSSGAFVPTNASIDSDKAVDSLIVGRTDLRPVLTALQDSGRRMWVISDSCYSGQQVRSMGTGTSSTLPARMVPLSASVRLAQQKHRQNASNSPPPPLPTDPYPYNSVAFLSAASEGEVARDIPAAHVNRMPTIDGKAHGAFSDALLRVLDGQWPTDMNRDGYLSLAELHRAVVDQLNDRATGQTPQRLPAVSEDRHGIGTQPVLNVKGVIKASTTSVEPLRVYLEGDASDLASLVNATPGLSLAEGGQRGDLLIRKVGGRSNASSSRGVVLPGRVRLYAASGDLLTEAPASDTQRLQNQLRQLSWSKRMRALAEQHRRGVLEVSVTPEQFGGTFVIGQKIAFVVKPDRPATLVLLNISSDGLVSVLYPMRAEEAVARPAHTPHFIPGEAEVARIVVQEPEGMDFQFVLAFDDKPPGLEKLFNAFNLASDDERLQMLEHWLSAQHGKFTFASTSLRSVRPAN